MLDGLSIVHTIETVHRFANPRDPLGAARRMGLDARAVEEMQQFLGPASRTMSPEELLNGPFQPKRHWSPPPTRYSDGSWSVFYSALEKRTAEQEVGHHYVSDAMGDSAKNRTVYYSIFHCQFSGKACDLRPKHEEWQALINPITNNPFCQTLGREAIETEIDGFLAPSARNPDGTTVPVFFAG